MSPMPSKRSMRTGTSSVRYNQEKLLPQVTKTDEASAVPVRISSIMLNFFLTDLSKSGKIFSGNNNKVAYFLYLTDYSEYALTPFGFSGGENQNASQFICHPEPFALLKDKLREESR